MLRDLRSGAEHSVALEPGDFISYENEFFTHRVDADAWPVRVSPFANRCPLDYWPLGSDSLSSAPLRPNARPRRSSERWLLGPASLRRGLLEAVGSPMDCNNLEYSCRPISDMTYDCCNFDSDCPYEYAECVTTGCELLEETMGPFKRRRNIRFGHHKESTPPGILGQCVCKYERCPFAYLGTECNNEELTGCPSP